MSEEQTQQFLQQMQMLESFYADLTSRENTLATVLHEATSAIASIKAINEKPESNTLVPVGMGSFIKTKISASDKIVLNVGAGIAIEKDKDSALNYLESRIKEIEIALQQTSSRRSEIGTQLEQGREAINRMMQGSPEES